MIRYDVPAHEPSFLPEGSEWSLVWADEFDGKELDTAKWMFRMNFWGRPFDAYTDQGIVLDGRSNIELHRTERNGCYVSPQLQTGCNSFDLPREKSSNPWKQDDIWPLGTLPEPKFMHRYGYYECRCKFQREPDKMWSAFWTQAPGIGSSYDPTYAGIESDIMEHFKPDECSTGNIMGGYGSQFREEGRVRYKITPTADGYHRFGMDWSPERYIFYCDGKEVTRAEKDVSHVPEFILLTTEIYGYRSRTQKKIEGEFTDDAFIADYVRVFDRKPL